MKKLRILAMLMLAVALMLFAFTSCGNTEGPETPEEEHVHAFGAATCTEPATCECGETEGEALGHTVVNDAAVAATCTTPGKTAGQHCSACGLVITAQQVVDALGHTYNTTVTEPTCATDGYTTYTCSCGDSYIADEVDSIGHDYVMTETTATCKDAGTSTYVCACGDSYTEDAAALGHIDENLDVECDRDGCTAKVSPPADSVISTFTANCIGSKVSVDRAYYVVGTIVEVLDAKNGIFLLDDGTGEKFYFRLPKNADGVSHAQWEIKIVVGDKVQIYGKINKFSSNTAPNGQYWPAMQAPVATVLEQHPHDFTFDPAGCSDPAYCACGQSFGEPLGCADTNADNLCDDCGKNVNYKYEYVEIRTDNNSGVADTTAGTYTWSNDNFIVQVEKASGSQLYTTAKDHMRVYKGNNFVLENKTGRVVKTITVYLTNATQVDNFKKFLTGYTYTVDSENFAVTIEVDSFETITLTNTGSTTQIKGVEFGYEKQA